MSGPNVQIPLGAVAFFESFHGPDIDLPCVFESKEGQDELKKFKCLIKEAYLRKLSRIMLENGTDMEYYPLLEHLQLQTCDFDFYLRSCKFIEFDSCSRQLLEDNMLDQKNFTAFDQKKCLEYFDTFPGLCPERITCDRELLESHERRFVEVIDRYINELKELEYIDELYACRKSLGMCEFIKPESDFGEIFDRLKRERTWTNVSEDVLKIALRQHFTLLHALENVPKATNGVALNKPTELLTSVIQDAIDGEHHANIYKVVQKLLERRLEIYHKNMEFKRFVTQGVIDFDAYGIGYASKTVEKNTMAHNIFKLLQSPKDLTTRPAVIPGNPWTPIKLPAKISVPLYKLKKLTKMRYAVKLSRSGVQDSGIRKALPELLKHVRGKSTKGWHALMAGAVLVGFGVSGKNLLHQ